MRVQALPFRQLYIKKPETDGAGHLCHMPPFSRPVFNPCKHGFPVLPLPQEAEGLWREPEAGKSPAPDLAYRQDAGLSSRDSFFGSAGTCGLDCLM